MTDSFRLRTYCVLLTGWLGWVESAADEIQEI